VQRESRLGRRLRRVIEGLRLWLWRRILARLRVRVGCVGNCEFLLALGGFSGTRAWWGRGRVMGELG
jgi:hypothetical protein